MADVVDFNSGEVTKDAAPTFREQLAKNLEDEKHRVVILEEALKLVDANPAIPEYDSLMKKLY